MTCDRKIDAKRGEDKSSRTNGLCSIETKRISCRRYESSAAAYIMLQVQRHLKKPTRSFRELPIRFPPQNYEICSNMSPRKTCRARGPHKHHEPLHERTGGLQNQPCSTALKKSCRESPSEKSISCTFDECI